MMGVSPGGPAKLCDKLLVRAEALCAYGEQQKTHQQCFLLGGSVKRHRVNRCLWLLQAFAEFLSWTVLDWICPQTLAQSSLCQREPVLALLVLLHCPGGAKSCLTGGTRSYSFCLSAVPIHFCLTDCAVVCTHGTDCVKLWLNHGKWCPEIISHAQKRRGWSRAGSRAVPLLLYWDYFWFTLKILNFTRRQNTV